MKKDSKGKKIYILTVEYDPNNDEIEFIAEEIIDDKDRLTHIQGYLDLEENGWDLDALEYMREHYQSGKA